MSKKERDYTKVNQIKIHYKRPQTDEMPKIKKISQAIEILRTVIPESTLNIKEYFWVLLLSQSNHLLGISEIGTGIIKNTEEYTREIIQTALLSNAKAIFLVRNRPSDDLRISESDITSVKKIKEAAKIFKVELIDEILINSENFASMLLQRKL